MSNGPTISGIYYEEFSNFYNSPFKINSVEFSCTEQYFQYRKCHNNPDLQKQILQETDPKKMWSIGKNCTLPTDWEIIKGDVMLYANMNKFSQNEELGLILVNTGNAAIIFNKNGGEPDYWDTMNKNILETIRKAVKLNNL